jgi:hypothetical protein
MLMQTPDILMPANSVHYEFPPDKKTILENTASMASVGIALLKMLESLISDAGQDMQRHTHHLLDSFLTLTKATGIQGMLITRVLQCQNAVTIDGGDVTSSNLVPLSASRFHQSLEKNLSASKDAKSCISALDNSLRRLKALKGEGKKIARSSREASAFYERMQTVMRIVENNLEQMGQTLNNMVLNPTEEYAFAKDAETLGRMREHNTHAEMQDLKDQSSATAKTIADITSDVVNNMHSEDSCPRVLDDVTGLLRRYRQMLEDIYVNIHVTDHPSVQMQGNVTQAVDHILSGIRLQDVRMRCLHALRKAMVLDEQMLEGSY